jgi:glucose/arabinose dehydrogenase
MAVIAMVVLGLLGVVFSGELFNYPRNEGREKPSEGAASLDSALSATQRTKKSDRRTGQPAPYYGDLRSLALVNVRDAILEELLAGLDKPWAMEILPDNTFLINESPGRMKLFDPVDKSLRPVHGLPAIPYGKGQLGLMDVALHPNFESNGVLYFSYAFQGEGEQELYTTAVSRARLVDDQLVELQQIFVAVPFEKTKSNFGGALEFDDQGYLYIATGDRGRNFHAQETADLNGKIVRLDDRGEVPPDNPFVAITGIDDRIFALGVRNPQGLVFDTVNGILYEAEHGPMGGDEVNIIEAGKNYGWPTISYGANYNTQRIGLGTTKEGLEQPLFYFLPSVATSPITVYRGDMFSEWEGDLLVGALKGAHVSKLDTVDGQVKSQQRILDEVKGRVRDIKIGSDGSIYILVQNGGRLFRLFRDPSREDVEYPKVRSGELIYKTACSYCHSDGQPLIPQLADAQAWTQRLSQGKAVLYSHAIDGYRGMPERGLCDSCDDEEIRRAVDYMVQKIERP